MKYLIFFAALCSFTLSFGQYEFVPLQSLSCSSVKSQGKTGTCWSFSGLSFLESEVERIKGEKVDLSEMYVVRHIYLDKALNYVLRQGKANFSQGSLAHDVIRVMRTKGLVPESSYPAIREEGKRLDHSALEKELKTYLDNLIKNGINNPDWMQGVESILDKHMGTLELDMNPMHYVEYLNLKPEDYISITSFTHHPKYGSFILEIPDNYSNGSYYNVSLEELLKLSQRALDQGYSICWDGDVSHKGFSAAKGLAVLPLNSERKDLFEEIGPEIKVDPLKRQNAFMEYTTTDDHLMHITGMVRDQKGNDYFLVKNSWGEIGPFQGFVYMSEAYFAMQTVGITLHKESLSNEMLIDLGLE